MYHDGDEKQIRDAAMMLDNTLNVIPVPSPLTAPTHRAADPSQSAPSKKNDAQPDVADSEKHPDPKRTPKAWRDTPTLHAHPNSSVTRLIPVAASYHSANPHQERTHEGYLAHIETTKLSTFPQGHCGEPTAARLVRTKKACKPPSMRRTRPAAEPHVPVTRAVLLSVIR